MVQPASSVAAPSIDTLLARARDLAATVLLPRAQQADQAADPPADNLRLLADAGLLGLGVPRAFGGHEAPAAAMREFLSTLSSACGVTTFLVLQHVLAAPTLARSTNAELQAELLPAMASGRTWVTVCFSHLRRPGPPVMTATPDGDGYRFNGTAPWATGWRLAQQVILGGTLPDGRLLFVACPTADAGLNASAPLPLAVAAATDTVTVTARDVRVPASRTVKLITPDEMADSDRRAMLLLASLPLGVALAAERELEAAHARRPSPAVADVLARVRERRRALHDEVESWADRPDDAGYPSAALRLRAACIHLALRSAHAVVVSAAGSSLALAHPGQRLLREAMLYSTTAQTRELQAATLAGL